MNSPHSLPEGLGTALRALLGQLDPVVDRLYEDAVPGMRARYYPLLRSLADGSCKTIGELAAEASVSQPAMTQTAGQMINVGLLTHVETEDRRRRTLRLSPKGHEAVQRLLPTVHALQSAVSKLGMEVEYPIHDAVRQTLAQLEKQDFKSRVNAALEELSK